MFEVEAEGLEDVQATLKKLEAIGSKIVGVSMMGDSRGRVNNAEIIGFHAEGIESLEGTKIRNITMSDADAEAGANAFMARVEPFLESPNTDSGGLDRRATAVTVKGLKDAADIARAGMILRIQEKRDRDGMPLEPVKTDYASQREADYGVPSSEIFKASGNLLSNLARAAYKFTKK